MKFTAHIEPMGTCQHRLKIEVDRESVAAEFRRALEQVRIAAHLPGFRPGKAPPAIVEKRFAAHIADEVKRALIPESYRAAVREKKLRVVGLPRVEEVEFDRDRPLRYSAVVETAPDFPLPDYKGLAVRAAEPAVTDADVNEALQRLQEQHADFVDAVARPLAMGDFAVIHYEAVVGGKPLAERTPRARRLGEGKNFWLAMNAESFLPRFCDQLLGAQIGEKRQVLVDFPADFALQELQGQKATYFVELVGIKEKKLPELDDEFAKRFQQTSLMELRKQMRQKLEHQRQQQVLQQKHGQILAALLERAHFELPPSLVAYQTQQIIHDIVRSLQAQGATREAIEGQKEKIFGSAQQSAADRVRSQLILSRIAEAENISVGAAELEERLERIAAQYGVIPQQLRAQLEQRGAWEALAGEVLADKVLDFLLQHAKVEAPTP